MPKPKPTPMPTQTSGWQQYLSVLLYRQAKNSLLIHLNTNWSALLKDIAAANFNVSLLILISHKTTDLFFSAMNHQEWIW